MLAKVAYFDLANTPFVVHPAPDHIPGVVRPAHGDFGLVRLAGYEQNGPDELVLYWRADEAGARDYTVRLSISGADGALLQEIDNPYPGDNPTSTWSEGLLVRDPYRLPLPDDEQPAVYHLSVALLDPSSGELLAVLDGPEGATTVGVGHIKQPPPPVQILAPAVDATFTTTHADGGEAPAITLSHALLPQSAPRSAMTMLTLYWRSEAPVAADYTVYLHLLRPDGEFVAAFDAPPLDGRYPTSFWSPAEQIVDARELRLDAPPGDYLLRAGLYDPASGERLLLAAPHEGADGLVLGTITIRP